MDPNQPLYQSQSQNTSPNGYPQQPGGYFPSTPPQPQPPYQPQQIVPNQTREPVAYDNYGQPQPSPQVQQPLQPYPYQQSYTPPMPGQAYQPQQQPTPGVPAQFPTQQNPQQNPAMGYNPYPYPGEYDQPKAGGSRKLIVVAILAVAALGLLAVVTVATSGNNNGTTLQDSNQPDTSDQDVIPRSDNSLDLGSRLVLNSSLKAQTLTGNVSEQLNLSSGFSFMATDFSPYTPSDASVKAADGKKFVVVTAVVGNRLETGNISVSYLDFRLRDTNGTLIAGHALTNSISNNSLSSPSEIKPGEQITGKIVFEVATNDTQWVLKHSETYQKTTDNSIFTVEGEVSLRLSADSTN